MKALILNSGMGSRMGVLTSEHPKCMTEISVHETILSRQLKQIADAGIRDVVITTGLFDTVLTEYCRKLRLPLEFTFVKNPVYDKTNYIYSIYCAREYLDDDILLMHGDLVFENEVLDRVLAEKGSCMAVSSTMPLPEKDFKAQVRDGTVMKVGVDIFDDAVEAQALYRLRSRFYKNLMEIKYDNTRTGQADDGIAAEEEALDKEPIEVLGELYEKQNGTGMSEFQKELAARLIAEIWGNL